MVLNLIDKFINLHHDGCQFHLHRSTCQAFFTCLEKSLLAFLFLLQKRLSPIAKYTLFYWTVLTSGRRVGLKEAKSASMTQHQPVRRTFSVLMSPWHSFLASHSSRTFSSWNTIHRFSIMLRKGRVLVMESRGRTDRGTPEERGIRGKKENNIPSWNANACSSPPEGA